MDSTKPSGESKFEKPKTTSGWRKYLPAIVTIVVLLAIILGIKCCINSTRGSVAAKGPIVELPQTLRYDQSIPIYGDDFRVDFKGNVAFVEIVPDDVYQHEKTTFLRKLFPSRLLGGDIQFLSDGKCLIVQADKYRGVGNRKYWIRAARYTGAVKYEEKLDRLLYSLVGRIVDGMCGYLVGRVGPGGLYGPDEFPQYAVGSFKPFIISARSQ